MGRAITKGIPALKSAIAREGEGGLFAGIARDESKAARTRVLKGLYSASRWIKIHFSRDPTDDRGATMPVNKPYYVTFNADRAPMTVDHSKRNPGPADGKQRAGYTSFVLDARITLKWDDGPPGADSLTPFFFESVNVFFFLKDFSIQISSDYRIGSCPYRVTREHELESHVRRPTRIFMSYRDMAVRRFNQIPLPTRQSPRRIPRGQGNATEAALMRPVVQAVNDIKSRIRRALDIDRRQQDSPAAYRRLYARCQAGEWAGRDLG